MSHKVDLSNYAGHKRFPTFMCSINLWANNFIRKSRKKI